MPRSHTQQLTVLIQQLAELSCFAGIKSISLIEQGDSHPCFKVVDVNNGFFAKYFKDPNERQPYNKLYQLVADEGLSPDLIYGDEFWQVSQFVEGTSLSLCPLSVNEKIEQAIQLMVRCHQSIDVNKLTAIPLLDMAKIIKPLTLTLSASQKHIISKVCDMLSSRIVITPSVLCHGDINFSNIILANKPWLLDFDCAHLADREFDIAMMIAVNNLVSGSISSVIDSCVEHYQVASNANITIDKEKVTCYLYFSFIINGLWYLEQSRNNRDKSLQYQAFTQFTYFDECNFITENLMDDMASIV